MTWVEQDRQFVDLPVWISLGGSAYLLHQAALSYAVSRNTDGLVPKATALTLHSAVKQPRRRIADLLRAGIWTEVDGSTYRVCTVLDDMRMGNRRGDEQPSRACRIKGRRGRIKPDLRRAVYDRDGWVCLHCGSPERLSLDHIYPHSLGGPDTFDNLQTLCMPCNMRKGVTT